MPESLETILLYITGAFVVLAVLSIVIALRLFRRSRTDVFWRRRREAGQRGWRLFLLGGVLLVLSGASCTSSILLSFFSDEPESPPATVVADDTQRLTPPDVALTEPVQDVLPTTALVDSEVTAQPTPAEPTTSPTPVPTVLVIVTATPPSVTPTATPFATFAPNVTPLVSSVTPSPNAALTITALDSEITDQLAPVNPRTTFDAGTTRIYLFVTFQNMLQGTLWRRDLYRDGALVDGSTYLWGSETDGSSYFFFGSDTGFAPGEYEIRLYIGQSNTPVSAAAFTITEPS